MQRIFSVKFSETTVNIALLILRVSIGVLMAHHGYQKLTKFQEIEPKFMEFLGLSRSISLSLTIGAELFCSLALVLGLLTRLALIPLIIAMCVAVFQAHHGEVFGDGEHAFMYMIVYVALLITGPGKYSADGFIFK
jgi:putative oxidoreductase